MLVIDVNKMKATIFKSFYIGLFYALITLISIVKSESSLYASLEQYYYSNQVEIELVITTPIDYDLSLLKSDVPPKWIKNFAVNHIDFLSTNKFTLIQYDSHVRHQLKNFRHTSFSNHALISILQKYNNWHQSSDEDSFCG